MNIIEETERILENFQRPVTASHIASALHLHKGQTKMITSVLNGLVKRGKAVKQGKLYSLPAIGGLIEGKVCGTYSGVDFFSSETLENDIKIAHGYSAGIMHGDRVLVQIRGNKCEVKEILEHGTKEFVGTVCKQDGLNYVLPDDGRIHYAFLLPKGEKNKAKVGDKVFAYITSYSTERSEGTCRIKENLGSGEDDDTAIKAVLRTYGIEEEFPQAVTEYAQSIPDSVTKEDIEGRLDLRKTVTVTIDGEDSKDLDDAVSLEMTEHGDYLLGVHIADVSHYVRYCDVLDTEARKRGTSVYIPGKVYPMLPKKLSNGICSLNEGEDRLTLSCFMIVSRQGKICDYSIQPSVIRSKHRLTYSLVTEMLENPSSPSRKKYSDIFGMLLLMKELTEVFIKNSAQRGAIDFDLPEANIILDGDGFPKEILPREMGIANRMIEEFMLAANRTVAKHLQEKNIPGIFRVHQSPEKKKTEVFKHISEMLGYSLPEEPTTLDYARILSEAQGKNEENLLKKAALRSMSKAKYKSTCDGHFGLAFDRYLHFTSPIRRYPDLAVHRALHWSFENNKKMTENFAREASHIADLCTDREINAVSCERDIDDIRKAQYMSKRIGFESDATVSGVTAYGIYAELPDTCEGFIPIGKIDGYYEYDEDAFALKSPQRDIVLGDSVKIRIINVNIPEGKAEFELLT